MKINKENIKNFVKYLNKLINISLQYVCHGEIVPTLHFVFHDIDLSLAYKCTEVCISDFDEDEVLIEFYIDDILAGDICLKYGQEISTEHDEGYAEEESMFGIHIKS